MSDLDMIEKVARALAKAHGENLDAMVFSLEELRSVPCWQVYASDARDAIAAMREPTEAMQNEFLRASVEAQYASGEGFAPSWAAAIDAALAKATSPD